MVRTAEAARLIEAEPEEVGLSSARLGNVAALAQRYVDERKFMGAITAVARRGKVVHFETCGNMDDEAGRPMQADTIFRMASMTKPIASVGLMTLYEEGRFQLDDPAARFVPQLGGLKVKAGPSDSQTLREAVRDMTIADLLRHTSGLGGSSALNGTLIHGTLDDLVERLGELPLLCDPGSEWNYGLSTDVVGYLCQVIGGRRLDEFLAERIFGPLGMEDTGFSVRPSEAQRLAAGYRKGQEGEPAYVLNDAPAGSRFTRPATYHSGAGGLVSTAADYIRFCKMLANGGELDGARILGARTLRFMTMNHLPGGRDLAAMSNGGPTETAREGVGFGLGFAVLLDPTVSQTLGAAGEYYWGGAHSTAFFISPSEDLIALFLTQLTPSSSYPVRRELRAAVYSSIID